jgi:hypothetical protein
VIPGCAKLVDRLPRWRLRRPRALLGSTTWRPPSCAAGTNPQAMNVHYTLV